MNTSTDTTTANEPANGDFEKNVDQLEQLSRQINACLIGQELIVKQVLIALLSNGHVLIEGVPGLGKTLLVRTLARSFGGDFKRIQFTPDLMPSDVTGHVVYDMNNKTFKMNKGPVFTNLLLADEINRAPAKSQAALLEVMQEKQVTLDGEAHAVPQPFMVMATQNPLEQEGTYPLPEAELDRFMMKIRMDFPSLENEIKLTDLITDGRTDDNDSLDNLKPIFAASDLVKFQQLSAKTVVDQQVLDYAVRIVRATREHPSIYRGAGSRACISLVRAAKSLALLSGRTFVLPDDIKTLAVPVIQHRIALNPDVEIEGLDAEHVLNLLLEDVKAPRQ